MRKEIDITIRELEIKDLEDFLYWRHPSREFHKFNGPYYEKSTEAELKIYVEELRKKLLKCERNVLEDSEIIANRSTDEIIGQVNWYWKSKETLWLEVGIVIFNENYWGHGLGCKALKMWINKVFEENPKLIRIGLTTWSGNLRMMNLSEKLGLKKEAIYRKARIVNGEYYDSVSYGILKEEWRSK